MAALACWLGFASAEVAHAQSLDEYLEAGREQALELREQQRRTAEAEAQASAAERTLFPSLTASARYQRNQREERALIPLGPESEIEEIIFVPRNEIAANAVLELPIIDVGAWQRRRAASAGVEAARSRLGEAENEIERRVAEAYYQYVGAEALVGASEASLEASRAHREAVESRVDAGLATELDLQRAEAQIARSEQTLAEAQLERVNAARTLRVLTGLGPSGDAPELEEDLSPEAPLETWLAGATALPRVRAARAQARVEGAQARSARFFYVPQVRVFAQERYTNRAAFGESIGWSVGVAAEWRLDFAAPRLADAERDAARAAQLQADIELRDARAEIEAAWERVRALRTRARAASAEAAATARAAEIARDDYPARASQLDVVLVERDALVAEVERVRALADLAYARAALRIAAGRGDEIGSEAER